MWVFSAREPRHQSRIRRASDARIALKQMNTLHVTSCGPDWPFTYLGFRSTVYFCSRLGVSIRFGLKGDSLIGVRSRLRLDPAASIGVPAAAPASARAERDWKS
jgi:hypothetical protein